MDRSIDFWAPRVCFFSPIPELDRVADLLAEAGEALLAANYAFAIERLRQADLPAVAEYALKIMGREDLGIHRRRKVEVAPSNVLKAKKRAPTAAVERSMYERDGFRCRFCGCRVVLKPARDSMAKLLPGVIRLGPRAKDCHAAFLALSAVPDHIIPHSIGGTNDLDNLVTACWPCNNGRGSYRLEEMGLIDPRTRAPIIDGWDGLGRILEYGRATSLLSPSETQWSAPVSDGLTSDSSAQTKPIARASVGPSNEDWFAELNLIEACLSDRLLAFLTLSSFFVFV